MKTIIYGAGMTGKTILVELVKKGSKKENILFTDSDSKLWNTCVLDVIVVPPSEIRNVDYDKIIIGAAMGKEDIWEYLTNYLDVDGNKIESDNPFVEVYFKCYETREEFIRNYAEIVYEKGIEGNVGEGGVFEGRFSRVLSMFFPDRKIYLFDTFEGFDLRDVKCDIDNNLSAHIREGLYTPSKSIEEIVSSLEHPENVIVKKGYFPESAQNLSDNFVFVNLDFDLYKPTIEGLNFFWPMMVNGGVILVHDYFNAPGIMEDDRYLGVKRACDEFCKLKNISYVPIGDEMSVAFVKH